MMDEAVKSVHPGICIGQTDATLPHPPGKLVISIRLSYGVTEIPFFCSRSDSRN